MYTEKFEGSCREHLFLRSWDSWRPHGEDRTCERSDYETAVNDGRMGKKWKMVLGVGAT